MNKITCVEQRRNWKVAPSAMQPPKSLKWQCFYAGQIDTDFALFNLQSQFLVTELVQSIDVQYKEGNDVESGL